MGSNARNIEGGFKVLYYCVDGRRNGVRLILKDKCVNDVLEVMRVFEQSDEYDA